MGTGKKAFKDAVKPYGQTDVLPYYSAVATKLKKFLKGKEIAARNWIPNYRPLLKRGSEMQPLFVEELANELGPNFFEKRRKHLKEVETELTATEKKIWQYFPPRKLSDFFYATNGESPGKPIERVFFDLDRGKGMTAAQAQEATRNFVEIIRDDKDLVLKHDLLVCWTGNSFHIFLLLAKQLPAKDYAELFQYSGKNPTNKFTGRWVAALKKQVEFKVEGGHEKGDSRLVVDSSQTPSGKLCRAPFSLHVKDADTVDGVDVPVEAKELEKDGLSDELEKLTPKKVLEKLDDYAKKLPARLR